MAAIFAMPTKFGGMGGSLDGLPWAETLMKSVMATMDHLNKELMTGLTDVAEEFEDLTKAMEERAQEFEDAEDLIGKALISNPLYMLSAAFYFDPTETPAKFFDRTLQTNAGVLTLDAVEYYVENTLRLPEANAPLSNDKFNLEG